MADINSIYGATPDSIPQSNPLSVAAGYVDFSNALLRNQQGKVALEQASTSLATQQMNRIAQQTYGLSILPDDQLPAATLKLLNEERAGGTISQRTYNTWLANLPHTDAPASEWRQSINSHLIGLMAGPEAVAAVVGTPTSIDNGQSIQPGMRAGPLARNAGAFTPSGASVPTYPSRAQLGQPTTTVGPDGTPGTVPLANTLPPSLAGPAGGGGYAPPVANPGTTGAPSPTNQPRLPGGQPQAGGFNPTGLSPGSASTMEASATQYNNDRASAGQYATRTFPLQQAISLYKAGVTTGPGSELLNQMKSFLAARATDLGLDPSKIQVAKFEELNKYLTNYINNQPFSGGSDAKLASAITGNPSVHISDLAGADVSKALLGIERMKQAAILNYKGAPQGYADYLKNYSTTVDPRAFIADFLAKDPDKLNKMLRNMTPGDLTRFRASLKIARENGLLTTNALPAEGQ